MTKMGDERMRKSEPHAHTSEHTNRETESERERAKATIDDERKGI